MNKTHLTLKDRETIESMLFTNSKLNEIALAVNKNPRTISREIRRNLNITPKLHRLTKTDLKPYKKVGCKKLQNFPYCCNGCKVKMNCQRTRLYYCAKEANETYKKRLKGSRSHIQLSQAELERIDDLLLSGLSRGMSPYGVYASYPEFFPCSVKSIYKYLDSGLLKSKSYLLRKKPTMKKRKNAENIDDKGKAALLQGRKIDDYFKFIAENNIICPVQMDTVIGRKSTNSCLLTIHFVAFHFMLIFHLKEKSSGAVIEVFNFLEDQLGLELFKKIFPAILTDRGAEFFDPLGIEFSHRTGEQRTKVFYCDAYVSNQKAQIESNHRLLRYIAPKGTNFDPLDDLDCKKIYENIASYPRRELGGLTPFDMMAATYPEVIQKLKIKKVDRRAINLTPSLLASK